MLRPAGAAPWLGIAVAGRWFPAGRDYSGATWPSTIRSASSTPRSTRHTALLTGRKPVVGDGSRASCCNLIGPALVKAQDANCEQREDASQVGSVSRGGVRIARTRALGREEQRQRTVAKM